MATRRSRWLAPLLAVPFLLLGCFEPPVLERLELRFLTNGAVVVASRVEIADPADGAGNPALERRLADTRRALLDGTDPWAARFASLEPALERSSWEKRLGTLWRAERAAALAEPEELERFFADTGLAVEYRVEGTRAELTISPGQPSRATRRQRQQLERALAEWTPAVAGYLRQAGDLYRYLEEHPGRARACLGALFADVLSDDQKKSLPAPSAEEARRVEAVSEAMADVWDVLEVARGESHSLDEVSHLVYDPLPAPLTVKLPAPPLEVEGFDTGANGVLTAAGPGLWTALARLEGRWISPDPLLLFVTHSAKAEKKPPFDLDAFLQSARRAAPAPDEAEVRREIEARLVGRDLYRAVWTVDPESEEEFRWEE